MDLDFDIFFTIGVNSWNVQLECLHFKIKLHPNTTAQLFALKDSDS